MEKVKDLIKQTKRFFLPADFKVNDWESLESFYIDLNERDVESLENFQKFIKDWDELYAVVSEDMRWKYIATSVDTIDVDAQKELEGFYVNIEPKMKPWENRLNVKFNASPLKNSLSKDFHNYKRNIEKDLALFNEKNIELSKELSLLANEYDKITGTWGVNYKGKDYTMPQAANFLKSTDRSVRESVFTLKAKRESEDKDKLDQLLNKLVKKRHELALNAGYNNFRDYSFDAMHRFDYTAKDCEAFHESVANSIVPLIEEMDAQRKKDLGVTDLKPWDMSVDPLEREALKPFVDTADFVNKTVECFNQLDPYFGACIANMNVKGRLDLESRQGKAPGGYMMAMPESGIPFIFMNHALSEGDVRVMVHEGGHAIHSFLDYSVEHASMRQTPSEVAELASMAMELFSLEKWEAYYPNEEDLKRAKKNHLLGLLKILPGVAKGDAFQHWMYTNPNHTTAERHEKWSELSKLFGSSVVDYGGFEDYFKSAYQGILHFYQVPFYYIEYGFAQLGAIAMWRNFKQNNAQTIDQYKAALTLGYTRSIPEIYETAGIQFDFSVDYVGDLASFVKNEMDCL